MIAPVTASVRGDDRARHGERAVRRARAHDGDRAAQPDSRLGARPHFANAAPQTGWRARLGCTVISRALSAMPSAALIDTVFTTVVARPT